MTSGYATDLSLFINGEWRSGGGRESIDVRNPATGEVMAALPCASADDLAEALATAEAGFAIWRATDVDARAAALHKVADLVRARAESISLMMTMEQGKPRLEAEREVAGTAQMFDYYAEEAKRAYGRVLVRPTGERAMVIKQPVGPVALFTPWNFPIYLMAKKLAAALAAGCSAICKPAEETPGSASALMRCVADAGIPPAVAQMVFGQPEMISRTLIAAPAIRKVSFTGSTAVGQQLMRLAADGGAKRITMELGGHAPVLIFADCDLEKTLDMVVPQKFRNAGQVCVSPTRFFVEEAVHDAFVSGFAARTARVTVGNGLDRSTQMGPLAHDRRPGAVDALVADAVAKGAELKAGGGPMDCADLGGGYFYQPTLLANVPGDAAIMTREPFGPVAVTRGFPGLDAMVAAANDVPYGLAAFAFTQNLRTANLVCDALEAGMVAVNNFGVSVVDAPFGGVKQSGFGSEGGPEGLDSYMVTKAIHLA